MRHLTLFTSLIILTCGLVASVARAEEPAPTSFDVVTANLDEGGNFYLYMSTADFMKRLGATIAGYRSTLVAFAQEEEGKDGAAHMDAAVDMAVRMVDEGGLANVGGVGMSTRRVAEQEYRSKSFIHITEPADGKLVNVYGRPPHELTALKLLPAHTVMAVNTDFDAATMWQWVHTMVSETKGAGWAADWQKNLEEDLAFGVDNHTLAASLAGEFTVLMTMDPETPVKLTLDGKKTLDIGTPAMAAVIKVTDSQLFDAIHLALKHRDVDIEHTTDDGVDLIRTTEPSSRMAFKVQPAVAQADGYVIIASSDDLARQIVSTVRGKSPDITTVQDFLKWDRGMPDEANGFVLITPTLTEAVGTLQTEVVASAEAEIGPDLEQAVSVMKSMLGTDAYYLYQVNLRTKDGLASITNSSKPAAAVAVRQLMILPLIAATSEVFPVFAQDPVIAGRWAAVGKLKSIGLGLLVYAGDNGGAFPSPDGVATFQMLMDDYLSDTGTVVDFQSGRDGREDRGQKRLTEKDVSFVYIGAGLRDDHAQATMVPLAIEKPGKDPWVAIVFIDGHVEGFEYDGTTIEGVIDLLHNRYEGFKYNDETLKLLKAKAKAYDAAEAKR